MNPKPLTSGSSAKLPIPARMAQTLLEWTLHGMARLPLGFLYPMVATPLYYLIYHIARYRRKVVRQNIAESFPSHTNDERRKIEQRFYRNFADMIVETIKLLHISDEEMMRRMTFEGIDKIDRLFDEGKSIVAYFSHMMNWEWAPSITLWTHRHPGDGVEFCQVYRPLKNKWADDFFLRLRSRFNSRSLPKATVFRDLLRFRRDNLLSITGFMSDQKPSHGDPTYITDFLNHPTAMITGTETLGRRLDMAIVYWDMCKPSRGHYHITIKVLSDGGKDLRSIPDMEITHAYALLLQDTIYRDPSLWLWTHRRWKIPVRFPDGHLSKTISDTSYADHD